MTITIFLFALATSLAAIVGGMVALKNQKQIHRILGFTAGVLIGVVAFDLLPEIYEVLGSIKAEPTGAMIALVCGFLGLHVVERSILLHHTKDEHYPVHHHPHVGMASAGALIGHSFIDGAAIGLAFQSSTAIGVAVAIAVIAHRFTDGLVTVNLMMINKNKNKNTIRFLLLVGLAPILGALTASIISIPDSVMAIYFGFFAGFLLYIGASEILPEAHAKKSSYKTIMLTILGVLFMFAVSQIAH